MYLHETPHEHATTKTIEHVPIAAAKSWMTAEMFWMGMLSSIIAGVIVAKLTK